MKKIDLSNVLTAISQMITVVLAGLVGIWFVVIAPLGPNLSNIPGDFGDSRLNNYLLEHFFRWITGLDQSFWNAQFFYPYPSVIALSDNFLGSGIFYSIFRWFRLDQGTAFQAWYICGYILNYAASVFALRKLNFKPLAVAAGAFFFTFGLPVLAQENHVQLLYRFGVPLACLALWQIFKTPKLRYVFLLLLWTIWQFYLSIYTGVFLSLLLVFVAVIIPFLKPDQTIVGLFKFWPGTLRSAWDEASFRERLFLSSLVFVLMIALGALLWPYYQVTRRYDFSRSWDEVFNMLPNWRSLLISDSSQIWGSVSLLFRDVPDRIEHNLFIGVSAVIIIMTGLIGNKNQKRQEVVFVYVFAALLLFVVTFRIKSFTLYSLVWSLPGLFSIRVITRIILILMWPAALLISHTIDRLLNPTHKRFGLLLGLSYLLLLGLILDSIFYNHLTFRKDVAQKRVDDLHSQIPSQLPSQPILIVVGRNNEKSGGFTEIDGMLLARELGWPSLNGYSGSNPTKADLFNTCRIVPQRILAYMDFAHISSEAYYIDMMSRVVPVGFNDCNPNWALKKPTMYAGAFPEEIFKGLSIEVISIDKTTDGAQAEVIVSNHSSVVLPVLSSTGNPFRLSWRLVNLDTGQGLTGFEARVDLDYDIGPGGQESFDINLTPPVSPGLYQLEVSAVQEAVDWFYNRGLPVVKSHQAILIDDQGALTITELP